MKLTGRILALLIVGIAVDTFGQNTVTTSGGTANKIPAFTGSAALGDSPIWTSGSNVGIGQSNPIYTLDVSGTIRSSGTVVVGDGQYSSATPALVIGDGGYGFSAAGGVLYQYDPGNGMYIAHRLGIGTTSPAGLLDIHNPNSSGGVIFAATNMDPNGYTLPNLANTGKMLIGWNRSGGAGEFDFISNRSAGNNGGYFFYDYTNSGALNALMMLRSSGTGASLEINGGVKLTAGTGASMTYSDGTVQSTAWTGVLSGGDYAESIDVIGERTQYQPGDLLVIDAQYPDKFVKATKPYSQMVAGVYSTKPGLTGRRMTTTKSADEVPMAITGIVPTKVSAENGAIKPGDLLVSSSSAGYAMRGTSRKKMMGAVIGKAMGNLDAGKGVIEVLVYLQ